MSAVYRASHVRTGRTVAVKVLSAALTGDGEYRERFVAEARRASRVDEAHIIDVYDADEEQGHLYLAMRFVEGGDLSGLLRREGPLRPERALGLVTQVASALDAAHAQGLVHRDVKPGNILIGPSEHVYLSDFGVAKALTGRQLTQTGMFIGSPDYAAPEQWEGQRDIDGRADEYALAGVFHECLTGARPYERDSITGLMYAHLQLPPPQITELRPDLPPGLDVVLARAMAKERGERFATCGDFVAAAGAALGRGESAPTELAGPATVLAGPPTIAVPHDPVPAAPTRQAGPAEAETPVHAGVPATVAPPPAATSADGGRGRLVALVAGGLLALVAAGVGIGVLVAGRGGDGEVAGTGTSTRRTTTQTTTATTAAGAAFSTPASLFRPFDRGDSSATFEGDAYVFDLGSANKPLISVSDRPAPLDVRVQAYARSDATDYGAALICRYGGPGRYYMAAVASGRRYNVVKYTGGGPRSLSGGFRTSSAIGAGDAKNHLDLTCAGSGSVVLTLTVNGQQVASLSDAQDPLDTGRVGLRAGTSEPPAQVRFETFAMSQP